MQAQGAQIGDLNQQISQSKSSVPRTELQNSYCVFDLEWRGLLCCFIIETLATLETPVHCSMVSAYYVPGIALHAAISTGHDRGLSFRGFRSKEEEEMVSKSKGTSEQQNFRRRQPLRRKRAARLGARRVQMQSESHRSLLGERVPSRHLNGKKGPAGPREHLGTQYPGERQPEKKSQSGNKGTGPTQGPRMGHPLLTQARAGSQPRPDPLSASPHLRVLTCCSPAQHIPFPTSSLTKSKGPKGLPVTDASLPPSARSPRLPLTSATPLSTASMSHYYNQRVICMII